MAPDDSLELDNFETLIRDRNRDLSSKDLFARIKDSLMGFSESQDDVSDVLIKKGK